MMCMFLLPCRAYISVAMACRFLLPWRLYVSLAMVCICFCCHGVYMFLLPWRVSCFYGVYMILLQGFHWSRLFCQYSK